MTIKVSEYTGSTEITYHEADNTDNTVKELDGIKISRDMSKLTPHCNRDGGNYYYKDTDVLSISFEGYEFKKTRKKYNDNDTGFRLDINLKDNNYSRWFNGGG